MALTAPAGRVTMPAQEAAVDQTQFDFPLDDLKRRRRRGKGRKPTPRQPAPVEPPALLESPQLQQCGFCGHGQTVMGETAVCDACGGIIMRAEAEAE